ncbi:two-component system, OmpR family, response regulator [Salipaludibacillus aurantiacus]|uniref:Two-component system, OmpR family, response regulator n=2 Tax=Salipaludibacillus aurantiacus TaxID=1601833 RepID=A0A1H9SDW0_9BACI|nr:two-component system, OmpR family, response regulator [Salipaludibacillus aurantiacus]
MMGQRNFTILVADDEAEMTAFISEYIEKEGYRVVTAENGRELLDIINTHKIDLILLDVMMPVMNGFEALKEMRMTRKIPVIMVTAKSDENDRIQGLKSGADDYIIKPFSPRELLARVEAQLRRNYEFNEENDTGEMTYGIIEVNPGARKVYVNNELISLTRKEYDLLIHFLNHPEQVFNREQLLDRVWGMNYTAGGHRTVDTHMKTLRFKMKQAGEYFQTVYGVGYVLEKVKT